MVKNISKNSINEIKKRLSDSGKIVLLTHTNPDGDAMGSLLGLYNYFMLHNFSVNAITPNDYPGFLQWLPGCPDIIRFPQEKEKASAMITNADVIFNLDFNEPGRLEKMQIVMEDSVAFKILIDHHPSPEDFNDIVISETAASSTAELVFMFLKGLDKDTILNKEIAECLFTGIMTDTGCFSFNSSMGDTYRIVAELLDSGIHKDHIFDKVYNNFSEDRLKLLGYSINQRMVVIPEYKTAYIYLTQEELAKYNFAPGDSEGFVNYPLSIKGIRFTALFMEKKDHIKISFRSQGTFPVNIFSQQHFNGGGHQNAAGGESFEPLQDTIRKFTSLLDIYAKQLADK